MIPIPTNRPAVRSLGIFAAALFFIGCAETNISAHQVCFNDTCYEVELADESGEWQQGLMFREELPASQGMLFIFSKLSKHSFWMKNTLIPLDIIWLDGSRRIVHIEENVPPCEGDPCPSYIPSQEALYVLEINAGEVEANRIKRGQRADFRLDIDSL